MKALILTGGQGTRLRPFTCSTPKPLLPVVNVPFLHHPLALLRRHGVREVTLATAYRPGAFRRAFGDGRRFGLRIRYAFEKEPLGTGGAVRNACAGTRGTLLVLNGDVLHDMDFGAFLRFHRARRSEASIALTPVKDPTLYGLVETDARGRILRFLEKPSPDEISTNTINAGAYLFEPSVLERIPPGVYSLERGLFPGLLAAKRPFYAWVCPGYWLDIGTVEKYLQAHLDALSGLTPLHRPELRRRGAFLLEPGVRLGADASHEGEGRVLVGRGARVAAGVRFTGSVCLGPRCVVGRGAALEDCVLLAGARVGEGARLSRCVVGQGCRVGPRSTLGPGRALGDGSTTTEHSAL